MIAIQRFLQWLNVRVEKSKASRCIAAMVFGALAALSLPPVGLFPILWICFPALIILLRDVKSLPMAFLTGWSFAFGFLVLGLYWIANALFVDITQFWWVLPFAVAGLPLLFAIYYGIAMAVAWCLGTQGPSGVLTVALCWFLADYARGHMFTGFPWNLEGSVWSSVLPLMQSVSVVGIYGLTLITLIAACLPALLSTPNKTSHAIIIGSLIALLGIGIWGEARLSHAPTQFASSRIRVVQPNIEQAQKWNETHQEKNFDQLLVMTSEPADKDPTLIVWPETASTYYLEEDTPHRRRIAAQLSEGSVVLTGVVRREMGPEGKMHYANSLVAVDRSGRIVTAYDKNHLVPFGEYMPFRKYLPFRTLVNLGVDFSTGDGLRTLRLDNAQSFSPLICYEAIFPGEVARADDRPDFLLNITNDGWYGISTGPYQHFESAKTRAIEEGLPLVRAANTGISAVIDAHGRVVTKLDLGRAGYIDATLPKPIPPTIFSRWGERPLWAIFAVFVVVGGLGRTRLFALR